MNRDKLVSWFIANYPQYYKDMFNSNHCVDLEQPNPFHAEGTVWTHTMMVMTWIEAKHYDETEEFIILLTAGLLHDLGKPTCEERNEANDKKPLRNSFKGHEGVSVMLGVGVLKQLKEDFPQYYNDTVIEMILKVVGTHGVALDGELQDPYLFSLRNSFRIADKRGAVRQVDEGIYSQYDKRKFAQKGKPEVGKELVFMVGLPCSGKSTYYANNFSDYIRVSRDDMLVEWYNFKMTQVENAYKGDASKLTTYSNIYKWVHETKEKQAEFNDYFEKMIGHISKTFDKVVIDMTMMPASSRRKMMNKFPKHERKAIVLWTDKDSLAERNLDRDRREGKFIPDAVFSNMAKSFTYPVLEEGFEEIKLVIN